MEKFKFKTIILLTIFVMLVQMLVPILENVSIAESTNVTNAQTDTSTSNANEWDISKNRDGSVIAKYSNGTLTISGKGEMKDFNYNTKLWNHLENQITKVEIKEGVTNIGNYSFDGCSNLKEIEIPEGVTKIGKRAFSYCRSLQEITISESITSIDDTAFRYCCYSLQRINVDENNEKYQSIEGVLYTKDKRILICYPPGKKENKYSIVQGVVEIANYAFEDCTNLREITIPEELTSIGDYAFYGCSSLCKITIPKGVTNIGNSAFSSCKQLREISIPSGVTKIAKETFNYCEKLRNIEIPDGIISIEDSAFYYCKSLENIIIPEGVTNIGSYSFRGCSSLSEITIPEGVTSIGEKAFYEAKMIKIINRGETLELPEILKKAKKQDNILYTSEEFELTNCSIQNNKIIINDKCDYAIIKVNNGNLEKLQYVITYNEFDLSKNGDNSIIAQYSNGILTISGKGEMKNWGYKCQPWMQLQKRIIKSEIKEGVTNIVNEAFDGCSNLQEVTIAEGVTSIGKNAFSMCNDLEKIKIPDTVTNIGQWAFVDCINLQEIKIPDAVTSIGEGAFYRCYNIDEIKLPKQLTQIQSNVFGFCSSLKKVIIPEEITTIDDYAFEYCNDLNIICKSGSVAEAYAKEKSIKYTLDNEKPIVKITENTKESDKQISATIVVSDKLSGIREECLKYIWSTKESGLSEEQITETFENGSTITKQIKEEEKYYLWIYAKDSVGNSTIQRSVLEFEMDKYFRIKDYEITQSNYINGIQPNTTVETLKSKIETNRQYKIKEKGIEVTTGLLKTGQIVEIEGKVAYTIVVKGDCNGDGKADFSDILVINKHRLNNSKLTEEKLEAADVNKDGYADINDIFKINKYRLKKINSL